MPHGAPAPGGGMTAAGRRETRALLARAVDVQADAEAVAGIVGAARAEVVAAYEVASEPQVWAALGTMSIETLKDTVDGRARLDELPAHGIRSVADVLRAGPRRLTAVPGIGDGTARRTIHAAEQLKRAARDALQFRIEFDPKDPDMTRLVRALATWGAVWHAAGAHEPDATRLAGDLARQRPVAAPAGSLRRWFMRAADRATADDAARRVRALVDTAESAGLPAAARAVRAVRPPGAKPAWRDYERRSADYYGLLSQVVGLGGDVAASEGFLPADIVERVGAQQLDTSRLSDGLRLRGYQSFGARFALVQRRVVLGDEMGLGKTVQAIAAMAHLAARGATHFLVVCPASVLINWSREIARHSTIPVVALHGSGRSRAAARWRAQGGAGVVTFGSLGALGELPLRPAMLVVDEAHYVKNPDAKRSQAVNRAAAGSERVLFLTGTPMENRIDEFRALIEHLRPDVAAGMGPEHAAISVEAFRRAAAPVYLRRNQPDVLTELPELVQVDEWEQFSAEDGRAYRDAVREGNFMAMRRAAFAVRRPHDSAKLTRLLELAREALANGRKVVVFSYFRDVLAVVGAALGADARGPITGATPVADRQRIVDAFTAAARPAVLVCQIEAAGVGVNIQAASVVILCEPQVKPSIEAQAIARAHRMGQVRTVQVHRLLIADSVDERMIEILGSKAQLFDAYVRHSTIAQASPGAVDISEVQLARMIVAEEQQRLAGTPEPPRRLTRATPG
ncbi:ATP-dependent helicase [Dactylosporangium aurantiacum]|uniref:ATP-dependent helicase n=1 Tax=Dactylosporangium aurantiacum TaxID=35754 RepID=A0A9Q9IBY9_9ACTN|nr:SNF2-related protein [Dactylosporangium aurantiacum]MDG6101842.1 SNF2-related protein [Dactylosporangium aurantiacum]UWZ52356.1 ATP-dependent helicase [Dactylosporangium aurantiacum]